MECFVKIVSVWEYEYLTVASFSCRHMSVTDSSPVAFRRQKRGDTEDFGKEMRGAQRVMRRTNSGNSSPQSFTCPKKRLGTSLCQSGELSSNCILGQIKKNTCLASPPDLRNAPDLHFFFIFYFCKI